MCWEYKLGAEGGQGIWTEEREYNMLTGNGWNKGSGEAEKWGKKEISRKR